MGYAVIAGLPAIYGLYASIVPLFIYAFLGTSREVKIGATAVLVTLLAEKIPEFAKAGTEYKYLKTIVSGMTFDWENINGCQEMIFIILRLIINCTI